jgi:ABC-type uncharacterized transport system auxiliary subunit
MMKHTILPIACLLLASACSFTPRPADELYLVKAAPAACNLAAPVDLTGLDAAPGLDTSRIAIFTTPTHLTYYTGARWAATAPQMLRSFVTEAFEQAGGNVVTSSDNPERGLEIALGVRDFEVVDATSPAVRVRFVATVHTLRAGKQHVWNVASEKRVTSAANHMPDSVAAFNRASNEAMGDIVHQIAAKTGGCGE